MAELKEDKLIIKNDNIVKKGAKDGWALIKIIWMFLRDELPQFLSNWRTVPRIMMALYGTDGGGYSYRLAPAAGPLTEPEFQKIPLRFVGQQTLRWGGMPYANAQILPHFL